MTIDAHAEDLYGGDPATFVARRDALVKALRAAGLRDQATGVKALRRPTAPAATLNAVARSQPAVVSAALDAADALARTQRRALSGLADADVRGAVRAHHATIVAVIEAADPQSVGVADAMRSTLLTAAVDVEVAAALRRGVLAAAATQQDASAALMLSAPLSAVRDAPPGRSGPTDEDEGVGQPDADVQAREAAAAEEGVGQPNPDAQAREAAAAAAAARRAALQAAAAEVTRAERAVAVAQAAQVATGRRRRTAAAAVRQSAEALDRCVDVAGQLAAQLERARDDLADTRAVAEAAEEVLDTAGHNDDEATARVRAAEDALAEATMQLEALEAP